MKVNQLRNGKCWHGKSYRLRLQKGEKYMTKKQFDEWYETSNLLITLFILYFFLDVILYSYFIFPRMENKDLLYICFLLTWFFASLFTMFIVAWIIEPPVFNRSFESDVERIYKRAKEGKKTNGLHRNGGFYIDHFTRTSYSNEFTIKGITFIIELLDCEFYRDPPDMVEWSTWNIVGIKGYGDIKDIPYEKFLELMKQAKGETI